MNLSEHKEIIKKIEEEISGKTYSSIYGRNFYDGASFALDNITPDVAVKYVNWIQSKNDGTLSLKKIFDLWYWRVEKHGSTTYTDQELFIFFITNIYKP